MAPPRAIICNHMWSFLADLIATHQQNTTHYASSNVATTTTTPGPSRSKAKSFLKQIYSASYYKTASGVPILNGVYAPGTGGTTLTKSKDAPPQPPPRDDLATATACSHSIKRNSTYSSAATMRPSSSVVKIIDTSNNNNYNFRNYGYGVQNCNLKELVLVSCCYPVDSLILSCGPHLNE